MIPSLTEFSDAIIAAQLDLSELQVRKAALFAHILHRENENQNLTRILGVGEFVQGHLIDVVELLKLPTLGTDVADIGSGSGVPGLLAAAVDLHPNRMWYLVESEIGKAEFLSLAIEEMKLSNAEVIHARAEEAVKSIGPDTIVARAVGTVEKIAGWISNCSTWNNLILFKSRGWQDEWLLSQQSRFGRKLTITHSADYSNSERTRILISLSRSKK
jgi:16S rRNA (guanine527-N7)-methyltransferase